MRMGPDEGFDFEPIEVPEPTVFDKAAAERLQPLQEFSGMWELRKDGTISFEGPPPGPERVMPMDTLVRFPLMEEDELPFGVEFLSIPKHTIPDKAREFCRLVESGATKDWCQCLWEVHRDHAHIPENHCVICQEPREAAQHHGGPVLTPSDVEEGYHSFRGRGLRLKETRISCPVHVKEGLILGFFEWVFKDAEDVPSTDDAPGEPPATGDGEIPGGALPTDIPGSE